MMHRLLIPLALILAATNLFGQTEAQGPNQAQKPKPEGNCTVSGRVVSAVDGSPLRSARVGLVQRDERKHPQIYGATTDNEGRFEIKEIVAGRYLFFAAHSGYLEQEYKATKSGVGEGAILSLISGQEVTDVLFRLVRAAIITGRVVDDTAEPMTGVNVSVLRNPTEDEKEDMGPNARKSELRSVSVGVTDDRGEYRIFGLDPGDYYVKVSETGEPQGRRFTFGESSWVMQELGSLYAPLYYPGVLQLAQAQTVLLRAGDELQADFSMRRIKTVEVTGRVIGVDGSPTNRAFVNLMAADESDYGGQMFKNTDDKGEFTFKGVSPGSYVLSVQQHDPDVRYSAQRKVEVGEEKVDSIVIALGRGATIRGRIVASGSGAGTFGRVYVGLETTSESDTATPTGAEVKKDSSFEFTGVSDGSYAFHAHVLEPGWS